MDDNGPFSLDHLHLGAPGEWIGAVRALGEGRDEPMREALRLFPSEHGTHEIWRAWSDGSPLFPYEKKVRQEWDATNRAWLLPVLWSCVDQACWSYRFPLAERLAKRAVGRCLELEVLPGGWEAMSYLALARVYLVQERLDLADSILENLPPSPLPEVVELASLHRRELRRLQGQGEAGPVQLALVRGEAHFAGQEWEVALAAYREAARLLSDLRPGRRGLGPFAPEPQAWPCLPDLAWPWPVAFAGCSLSEARQAYLHCQGQMARCLRNLGRSEEARAEAALAKGVRQTRFQARLAQLDAQRFPNTVSLSLTLEAPRRQPRWLVWDSAQGDLEQIDGEHEAKLVMMGPRGQSGEEVFAAPLPEEAVELRFFGRQARSSQLQAVTYALWMGFELGPPLYVPVVPT